MDASQDSGTGGRLGLADGPLILEDLLCRIEEPRATGGGDPATVVDLLAPVEFAQGR